MGIYAVYTYGLGIKNATVFDIMIVTLGESHCKYTLIFHISIFVHRKMDSRGEVVTAGDVSPRRPVSRFSLITLHLLIHTLSLGFMRPEAGSAASGQGSDRVQPVSPCVY